MAPYSMDLRTRVLRDWDAGMKADDVAAKYSVSRAWVHRLQQRRRETGTIAPRRQTRWRTPILTPHLAQLEALIREQPDRTLGGTPGRLGVPLRAWRPFGGPSSSWGSRFLKKKKTVARPNTIGNRATLWLSA